MTAKGRESNFTKVKKRFSALNRCFAQYPKGGPNYRGINKEASQLFVSDFVNSFQGFSI